MDCRALLPALIVIKKKVLMYKENEDGKKEKKDKSAIDYNATKVKSKCKYGMIRKWFCSAIHAYMRTHFWIEERKRIKRDKVE